MPNPIASLANNPVIIDYVMERTGVKALAEDVNDMQLGTVQQDFGVLHAQVNEAKTAVSIAASLPMELLVTLPGFAAGLMGFGGPAGFACSGAIILDSLALVVYEHGFDLVKPYLEAALAWEPDQAKRDMLIGELHQEAMNRGFMKTPDASPRQACTLTRFLANGVHAVADGRGLRAVVAPFQTALEKIGEIGSATLEKATPVAGRIWDKVALVGQRGTEAATAVQEAITEPAGWVNWVPVQVRRSISTAISSAKHVASQYQSPWGEFGRSLSAFRATYA